MKFLADGMLGSLVRWLRMLGHDVEYYGGVDDDKLMSRANAETRVLLTRDLELYKRATANGIDAFYVEGINEVERLTVLAERFALVLEIDLSSSRCPRCNVTIKPVPKLHVIGRVEKNTLANYGEFWECPRCKKIYWQGAHWPRIRGTLEDAKSRLKH